MTNRILDAYVLTHRADPAGAELRVVVRPEAMTPTIEIKGRLMGPRSQYATTVEIAYPYRELARTDHLVLRVLIPEPSFWEPKTPLLYEGPLELWDAGACCERITLMHGIRAVQLGDKGLRVNGRPHRVRGVSVSHFNEHDARRWHDEEVNCVLMPARTESMELLELCDRFGLFALGKVDEAHEWPRWPLACQRHPSFLGTVLSVDCRGAEPAAAPGLQGADVAADGTAPDGRFDFALVEAAPMSASVPALLKIPAHGEPPQDAQNMLGYIRRRL